MSADRELSRDRLRERLLLIGLCLPSLVLITLVMIVPLGWLVFQSILDESGRYTLHYYVRLVSDEGYLRVFLTTFEISFLVVVFCAAIGYPLAYFLSRTEPRLGNILLLCVLAPFWTPILVRCYAWLSLLQRHGMINETLLALGVIDHPLDLAYNKIAVVVGTVHVLLPYLVLPLYASMRVIPPEYLHASASLGASPSGTFWRVFFPLSLPGFMVGIVLVFVTSLGFYILPALLGGGRVILIAPRIADSVIFYSNWGPAAALGVALFILAGAVLALFTRLFAGPFARSAAMAQ